MENERTNRERRFTVPMKRAEAESRALADGTEQLVVTGYAAVFDTDSEIMGCGAPFVEQIKRGAFKRALAKNPDVRYLFDHEGIPLARTTNGTLTLREDPRGLYCEAVLNPEMGAARDVYAGIQRGDITQMSFAFTVAREEWEYGTNGDPDRRYIIEVDSLFDVSSVAFPAYRDTETDTARSAGSCHAVDNIASDDDTAQRNGMGNAGEQLSDMGSDTETMPALTTRRVMRRLRLLEIETEGH